MSRALRGALTVLVVINLLFVQLTDAVGVHWLLPMQVLAVTSPFTARLAGRPSWRHAWNFGVLASFAILVHDTATSGPRHLLEDGLILAAFCQVHLLNVLRPGHKPDLLFFNSFLIALVTSFFCQDVAFSLVFLVYAFVFIAALELAADRNRRPARAVLRTASGHAALLVAITGTTFATLPRDFRREGLVDDRAFGSFVRSSVDRLADEIRFGQPARVVPSDRIVMRIRPMDGDPSAVPALWRGAALDWYDARGWRAVHRLDPEDATALPWRQRRSGTWDRIGSDTATREVVTRVIVEFDDGGQRALFTPLTAVEVGVPADASPDAVRPRADGTFVRRLPRRAERGAWSYAVAVGSVARTRGDATGAALQPFLRTTEDRHAFPGVLHTLVQQALRGLPTDAPQTEVVERCRTLLAGRFEYLLPGEPGAARSLAAFLEGEGGGHCELFATGLALMLRMRGVPCRVATGYAVHEWDGERRCFVVRQRDAHAWVEVFDRSQRRWQAVDATPPRTTVADDRSLLDRLLGPLRAMWQTITSFDANTRSALFNWLRSRPAAVLATAARHPAAALALALGLIGAGVVLLRRRGRRRAQPVRCYERALRRAGVRRAPHETPREVLERLRRSAALPESVLEELNAATLGHERARFAAFSSSRTDSGKAALRRRRSRTSRGVS